MPNSFEKAFGISLPKCCSLGECCKGASPSTPFDQLLKRAGEGDQFARGFFSIMIPYPTHQDAEKVVPGLVQRTIKAAEKLDEFNGPEDLVFYHCRYLRDDNKCGVHEDRPQFCRDYPDTPFVVYAPGCAYETWANACKSKYNAIKDEVAHLNELKDELARLKALQAGETFDISPGLIPVIDEALLSEDNTDNLSLVLRLTSLHVSSPVNDIKFF